jgi:hypothetical protein
VSIISRLKYKLWTVNNVLLADALKHYQLKKMVRGSDPDMYSEFVDIHMACEWIKSKGFSPE